VRALASLPPSLLERDIQDVHLIPTFRRVALCILAGLLLLPLTGRAVARSGAAWRVLAPARSAPSFYLASSEAVDRLGNIYVADQGDHRVKKLTYTGKLVGSWGSNAPGPLHFTGPTAVAVDHAGNVYVADIGIVKLSPSGRLLAHWASPSPARLAGIAATPQGQVYVLSADAPAPGAQQPTSVRIDQLSAGGTLVTTFHTALLPVDQVNPVSLTLDSNGNIYASLAGTVGCARPGECTGTYFYVDELSPTGLPINTWGGSNAFAGAGLAADGHGDVYIGGTGQVEKLSSAGTVVARWSSTACGSGSSGVVTGLAFGPTGNLIIADSYGPGVPAYLSFGLLQRLSSRGKRLGMLGHCLGSPRALGVASGINVAPNGTIYVSGSSGLLELSSNGHLLATWAGPRYTTYGIGMGVYGNLYTADPFTHIVSRFTPRGGPLARWTVSFSSDASHPTELVQGITVDRVGSVYVTAANRGEVVKFNSEGHEIGRFGGPGSDPGLFAQPRSLAVDARGNIYVADMGNDRIQKLAPDGSPLAQWSDLGQGYGRLRQPAGVTLDTHGNIWVADTLNDRIVELSPGGKPLASWGSSGADAGQFNQPTAIATGSKGGIYVADTGNDRVQELVGK